MNFWKKLGLIAGIILWMGWSFCQKADAGEHLGPSTGPVFSEEMSGDYGSVPTLLQKLSHTSGLFLKEKIIENKEDLLLKAAMGLSFCIVLNFFWPFYDWVENKSKFMKEKKEQYFLSRFFYHSGMIGFTILMIPYVYYTNKFFSIPLIMRGGLPFMTQYGAPFMEEVLAWVRARQ